MFEPVKPNFFDRFFGTSHTHKWTEVQRMFTGGVDVERWRGTNPRDMERILFGITTIIHRCECGMLKTYEVKGDARNKVF